MLLFIASTLDTRTNVLISLAYLFFETFIVLNYYYQHKVVCWIFTSNYEYICFGEM